MSSDLNMVLLVGRLTKDVELKRANSGTAIAELSLASNYRTKHGDNWEDAVSYFDCTLMGKRADGLAKYLVKGTRIGVTGELRQDRWEKDGQKRSKVKVHVHDVQLLHSKRNEDGDDRFKDDGPPF